MSDDPKEDPPRPSVDPPAEPRAHHANGTSTWVWIATLGGLFLMVASIVPSMAAHPGAPVVLGDAEVVPVFGMVMFVIGLLVLLQEWSGLT
jgi:hypothetical protein